MEIGMCACLLAAYYINSMLHFQQYLPLLIEAIVSTDPVLILHATAGMTLCLDNTVCYMHAINTTIKYLSSKIKALMIWH